MLANQNGPNGANDNGIIICLAKPRWRLEGPTELHVRIQERPGSKARKLAGEMRQNWQSVPVMPPAKEKVLVLQVTPCKKRRCVMTGHSMPMNNITSLIPFPRPRLSLLKAAGHAGFLSLAAMASNAQTYDPIPTPYCNIGFEGSPSYTALRDQVAGSNPQGKAMAQFVLEAFALANANGGLLDSESASAVILALNRLHSMWVPSSLNFKSFYTDNGVSDFNAVEFITESLAQISYRFPKLLAQYGPVDRSGTIENLLSQLLADGQTGEINHHFTVGYTNIWLLRICNLVLTGQGPADGNGNLLLSPNPTALDRGRTDFMTWVATVQNNGVHEFMSPTYTGVDLEALGNIYLYARDPGIAAMAQQGAKLLWIDLYANWYTRDERMGGTHSRTYEFLIDEDRETDRFLYAVSHLKSEQSPAWPVLLTNRTRGYWRGQDFTSYVLPPPSDVPPIYGAQIAADRSRTILRSFVSDETNYDPNLMYGENFMANPAGTGGLDYPFSVGSTESFYDDPTFEGLTIMMPGDENTVNINYNTQGRQDYYLQHPVNGTGKAETLKPFVAAVQNAAETLFLASTNGKADAAAGAGEVASTVVIPNTAEVWIGTGSSPVRLSEGEHISLSPDTTIFIRASHPNQSDGLVTGIRFLLSTEMNGDAVGLTLANDGAQYNALRVTSVHSASRAAGGYGVIAFWTRTAYCPDTSTEFNSFRNALVSAPVTNRYDYGSGEISLSVPGLHRTLSVQANAATETTTALYGSDVDASFAIPLLNVDGTEYVPDTLQNWTSQDIGNASGGSAAQRTTNGLYTGQVQVVGAGTDIWGNADGFQFYYQKLVGDGTVIGHLTSMPGNGVDPWAKAGVMMRNDLTPGSMNALISRDGTKGQRFSIRPVSNGDSTRTGDSVTTEQYWFKLTRANDTFTGYSSPDGKAWRQVGPPAKISMNRTIYAGVAVTSRKPSQPLTTGFDSIGLLQQ